MLTRVSDPHLPSGLLIGAEWVTETTAGDMSHVSPSTGVVQSTFPIAGKDEVEAAIAAARQALPAWRRLAPRSRRDVLRRLAELMRLHSEEFGHIGALESGILKSRADLMGHYAAEWFEYYAGWTDKTAGQLLSIPGSHDYTIPESVGVVAVLMTWNGPTGSLGMTCAAPLAAGCTIVLKAPELAPFSSVLFGQLCLEAGIPSGVVNVITGGPDAGEALVSSAGIDKISFTGSPAVAKRIQASAAQSLTPALFELGGKSANIVFPDADLPAAIDHAVGGVCALNGQTCIAPTRLLVHQDIYEGVVDEVASRLSSAHVGDPFDSTSEVGPLISENALETVIAAVAGAVNDGQSGSLRAGGARVLGDLAKGFYMRPALFEGGSNDSALAQGEVFGPVVTAIPFVDEEDAIRLANGTEFGLAAYVHTTDLGRAHRLATALEAGNVAINGGAASAGPVAPFGGFGQSGHGKVGGSHGLEEFLRHKNVNIRIEERS